MDVEAEQLRLSGFKRILVRLDEGTRRKYCCRALEEDLQHVKGGVRSCADAMAQARQVQDATRKLHASQRAAVSMELLAALETLQTRLETSTNVLVLGRRPSNGSQNGLPTVPKEEKGDKDKVHISRLALLSRELDDVVSQTRRLEKLMPPNVAELGDKQRKWWRKHLHKLGDHVLGLVTGQETENRALLRLDRTLKKMETKWPELKDWKQNLQKQIAEKHVKEPSSTPASGPTVKARKKRAIPLPDDGETAMTSGPTGSAKSKGKNRDAAKETNGQSTEKTRAQLLRCSKEVRTLRDKFELGAYDVNLSRMVTVVDSLWSGFDQAEVVSLTTALFTLVEAVEKVVDQAKRRDRLLCLISVLGVVLASPKLQLTARMKTMVEEYANNCRQLSDSPGASRYKKYKDG
ncbi:Histone deacetylase [Phytophthora cinnamomi]|uniref:Histone deacetylase n=1 Tax=Phytophthora cinnamomi TaxID=4785 RepID=UPI00355AA1C1|nr:Histone deacetylase [Phytophthora cinnamomi]